MADTPIAADGLRVLRTAAGYASLEDRGWIAVTGVDRVRWLNGMVTNNVQALQPGQGAYTFLLNAQGRIQGDATVWCGSDDLLLLETDLSQREPMMALLDRFIIMDDVELAALSDEWKGVRIAGLQAKTCLEAINLVAPTEALQINTRISWRTHTLTLITAHGPVVPRFEIWSRDMQAIDAITTALHDSGAVPVPDQSFELLRILEGTPRFGVDIRDKDLPQETAQTRALHFNKGCYLGQEIVERIRSRGQVHRTFVQFVLTGDIPAAGTELQAEGKATGVLTSVASEPIDGLRLALGYVRREAMERRLPLHYEGGTAAVRAAASETNTASNA